MRGHRLPRLDLVGTIQGHYAGEALRALLRLGVLEALATPREVRSLARRAGVDPALLEPVLEFLRRTTDVVVRDRAGRYRLGAPSLPEIAFQLEKFIGAYGPSLRGLDATLGGARSRVAPDDGALARAFAAVAGVPSLQAGLLRGLGVRGLLDLGCGPGSLLVDLARDASFRGIGVDSSAAMCRLARSRLRAAGVQGRVTIRQGDATRLRRALAGLDPDAIDAVHGRSLLNALFARGPARAVGFLRELRARPAGPHRLVRRLLWRAEPAGWRIPVGRAAGPRAACLGPGRAAVRPQGLERDLSPGRMPPGVRARRARRRHSLVHPPGAAMSGRTVRFSAAAPNGTTVACSVWRREPRKPAERHQAGLPGSRRS